MADDTGVQRGGLEPDTHAFVLRVWREESGRRARWRGRITHVASGESHPLLRLDDLALVVGGYLEQMEIRLPLIWRVRRRLRRPR